jgi:hypothetical protein
MFSDCQSGQSNVAGSLIFNWVGVQSWSGVYGTSGICVGTAFDLIDQYRAKKVFSLYLTKNVFESRPLWLRTASCLVGHTGSQLITKTKHRRARLVLGWATLIPHSKGLMLFLRINALKKGLSFFLMYTAAWFVRTTRGRIIKRWDECKL